MNIFLASFGIFGNAYIDLTPEGLYTLTSKMTKECEKIFYDDNGDLREPGITITFCDDRDNIIDNTTTRVIYYMAVALSKKFPNCNVECYNVKMNPTSVAKYKTTSLTSIKSTDVIVSYGTRYRILSAESFWHIGSNNTVYAYDGEYKLASVMLSLTLVNRPVAYFVTDHGETYYDVANPENENNSKTGMLVDLLQERGLAVANLSLKELTEKAEAESLATGKRVDPKIPDDCVLLIINNPTSDLRNDGNPKDFFYVSESDMLNRYMLEGRGSVVVTLDYDREQILGNLEDFLYEWGMECTRTLVTDTENKIDNMRGDDTTIIADYNLEEGSYANDIYGAFASMSSAPKYIIDNAGSILCTYGESKNISEMGASKITRIYAPFLNSSDSSIAYAKGEQGEYNVLASKGGQTVAAITGRENLDTSSGESTYSYVFCAASADFFSTDLLSNASYANYDIISSLVQNIARTDTYADSSLGGLSMNNSDDSFGGKMLLDSSIREQDEFIEAYTPSGKIETTIKKGLTDTRMIIFASIIAAIPIAIAVTGVVICVKRKYL